MLISLLFDNPLLFVSAILAAIIAFTFHEFAHAAAATLLGDDTAKQERRLSLNPFAHLDVVGFSLLLVSGFGWAKPVPYNPYGLKTRFGGNLLIPLAGPAMNFVQSIIAASALRLFAAASYSPDHFFVQFFGLFLLINLLLGFFNLIPIPPLDGSRIMLSLFPDRYEESKVHFERSGPFLLILIIILDASSGFNFFAHFLNVLSHFVSAFMS
ncbi:MAG: site-2 protease family protein [bacterium]|nr:site-2 protease family protein [bacterium]